MTQPLNTFTPEQAAQTFCPFKVVIQTIGAAANADQNGRALNGCVCEVAACSQWVWTDSTETFGRCGQRPLI